MDYIPLATLVATLAFPLLAFAFRKRILKALGRMLLTGAVLYVQSSFFDEVVVKSPDGASQRLMRPNARFEALLARYGPLSAAWAMEWARRNVKIKLPPFTLPEGTDLKTVGMSSIASKVLAGKKLKLEDAIPLGIGYAKDLLEKSGILDKLTGVVGGGKETGKTLSKEAQAVLDAAKR